MTVNDFVYLMADPAFFNIEIFNLNNQESVYKGNAEDIPDEYIDLEICSIDSPNNNSICVNIEYEEE